MTAARTSMRPDGNTMRQPGIAMAAISDTQVISTGAGNGGGRMSRNHTFALSRGQKPGNAHVQATGNETSCEGR